MWSPHTLTRKPHTDVFSSLWNEVHDVGPFSPFAACFARHEGRSVSFVVILPLGPPRLSQENRQRDDILCLGVRVEKQSGLACVCEPGGCPSQTTSCPGFLEAGGPRWRPRARSRGPRSPERPGTPLRSQVVWGHCDRGLLLHPAFLRRRQDSSLVAVLKLSGL